MMEDGSDQRNNASPFALGEWLVDPIGNTFERTALGQHRSKIKVEKRLIRVLVALKRAGEKGVTKQQLLDDVWENKVVSEDAVSVAISQLRKLLGCNARQPVYIETIAGYGFRLLLQPRPLTPSLVNHAETRSTPVQRLAPRRALVAAAIAICVTGVAFGWVFWSAEQTPSSSINLLDNEVYAKARFLMQQPSLTDLRQAELLLSGLNQSFPDTAEILNELGKAKMFQVGLLAPEERELAYQQAKIHIQQALTLKPQFGDAHLQMALISAEYDLNPQKANEHFVQAIAMEPQQRISHSSYANLLVATGDFKQALHHNRVVQQLDPITYACPGVIWVYTMAGEYAKAEVELAKLYTVNPDSLEYDRSALRLFELQGREDEAFRHYRRLFQHAGYSATELAEAEHAFAQGGLKQLNDWLANVKQEQKDVGEYYPPISTARYLVTAGELDRALEYLEVAYQERNPHLLWINSDPRYAALKAMPRFQALLAKLNLAHR